MGQRKDGNDGEKRFREIKRNKGKNARVEERKRWTDIDIR